MVERDSAKGRFFGCSKFPNCRGTRKIEEVDTAMRAKTPENGIQSTTEHFDKAVLQRLADVLEKMNKRLENLDENYKALATFFRSQSDDKQGVSTDDSERETGL